MNINVIVSIIFSVIGIVSSISSVALYYKAKDLIDTEIKDKLDGFVTHAQLLQHQIDCRSSNDETYASIDIVENLQKSIDGVSKKIDAVYDFLLKKG